MKCQFSSLLITAASIALAGSLRAAVTVDFDPTGELAAQFTNENYTENATGGLNSSVAVNLANGNVANFDGSQSESYVAGAFTVGSKFTVGAFFNMSHLGSATGINGQILRLGLTNGGTDNFANLPFSTVERTNTSNAFRFVIRQEEGADTDTFALSTGQWYYFETTYTRTGTASIQYDMDIATASGDGSIGNVFNDFSLVSIANLTEVELNKALYGAFKGHLAYSNSAVGVLDDFYVSTTGVSQIPEPSLVGLSALGVFGLLRRRRTA